MRGLSHLAGTMTRMCMMCDGATRDEVRELLRHKIDVHGWASQAVMARAGLPGWVYTVGLTERFDHPELVVAACDLQAAHTILDQLVARVEDGASLVDLHEITLRGGERYAAGFAHPAQLRAGLLAFWTDLYRSEGRYDLPLEALVIRADELVCASCRPVDLRQPGPILNSSKVGRSGRDRRAAQQPGRSRPSRKGPTRPGQHAARRRP